MEAQQRQKQSGNTSNLQNRVKIPIALQVSDKGALLNKFKSTSVLKAMSAVAPGSANHPPMTDSMVS